MSSSKTQLMPDIAKEIPNKLKGRLDLVGMTEIEVPVQLRDVKGNSFRVPAKADAFVSLDDENSKGIHMSRLFLMLQKELTHGVLDFKLLEKLALGFVESHAGLSRSSLIRIRFDQPLLRPALKSAFEGWRNYPTTFVVKNQNGKLHYEVETLVTYSSTCPCSAALARTLIQENFRNQFGEGQAIDVDQVHTWLGLAEGINATPHSQRSEAIIKVSADSAEKVIAVEELIDRVENALGTPVQAAVKREDEMEFARLNAANLMFCEDAARKIRHELESERRIQDYFIKVSHLESLHPHNAVSVVVKGIENGFQPA